MCALLIVVHVVNILMFFSAAHVQPPLSPSGCTVSQLCVRRPWAANGITPT